MWCYSDACYARDNNTQKSVKICVVMIHGVFITWHSQSQ